MYNSKTQVYDVWMQSAYS